MKKGWVIGCGASLLCGASLPVAASESEADKEPSFLAPRSLEQPEDGTSFYVGTAYTARVWDEGLIGQQNLLRRAKPSTDAEKIWRAKDLAITSLTQSRGQPRTTAIMALDIDADGRVARCVAQDGNNNDVVLAAQACPVIKERMRFTPALELDGRPAPDRFNYRLSFRHVGVRSGNAPPAFQPLFSSPAPWPVPDATLPEEWPIIRDGYPGFRATGLKRPVPIAPIELKSLEEKTVGIAFSKTKDGVRDCVLVIPSGDAGLDDSACQFMRETYDPQLPRTNFQKSTMPYLVVGKGKPDRAYAPVGQLAKSPKLAEETAEFVRSEIENGWAESGLDTASLYALSFAVTLDAKGNPTDCRIRGSSGNDAADVIACDVVKESLHYAPAKDIFGQPSITRWQGWSARRR